MKLTQEQLRQIIREEIQKLHEDDMQMDMFSSSLKSKIKNVLQAIKKIDWYYPMSDDGSVYRKQHAYTAKVKRMIDQLPPEVAKQIRDKYQVKAGPGVGVARI